MSTPVIIILDGPSGVGKSSIAHALQEALLPEVWLSFAMDTILYTLPPSLLERINQHNDWSSLDFPVIMAGALASLRALADAGNRVIFDTTLSTPESATELLDALRGLPVASVAIHCAWQEIERRSLQRGDRTVEEARRGFEASPKHLRYDISVDTTTLSPAAAATEIISSLRAPAPL
jgi:chloramphenicol 3-O phosphotransferase